MSASALWAKRVVRWGRILCGRSYYHREQPMGRAFQSGQLRGYFNDLTGKTLWKGETDNDGIPISLLADGRRIQFATTIAQKALGHYDLWILSQEQDRRELLEFLLCEWLIGRQDERGGWDVWSVLEPSLPSKYSAMTQGQLLSILARGWKATKNPLYAESAKRALIMLQTAVGEGGVAFYSGDDVFLEEIPSWSRNTILNGWVFAVMGLYDYDLGFDDSRARQLFSRTLSTLKRRLPDYDAGFWSYYDSQRHMASPFYHALHIQQFSALRLIDDDPLWGRWRDQWESYRKRMANRSRALLQKGMEKLREHDEPIIVR